MTATWDVPGLARDVEILVDEWGVPHIYAESVADAFVAQGFAAARDRLFQIDLWRRRGLGRLAEVLGSDYVDQDRARRLFSYRGRVEDEWEASAEGTREAVESFVLGVNAYVEWVCEHPEALPPEFAALGYAPSLWAAEDIVRVRSHGLYYNAEQEVARARTLRLVGDEADRVRQAREPDGEIVVPDGLDLADILDEDLEMLRLALSPVAFDGRVKAGAWRESTSGSNNWVIAGERTATGRPILANDPHRAVTLPSLRYISHLNAPGLDVIGAGEPSLPGVSIGHNRHVAFGLTIWPIDHEDLYVYELNGDAQAYRYRDTWEPFERAVETIEVAGGDPVTTDLLFTRHGPVLRLDPQRRIAVAVRAAWLLPGMTPYLGSVAYQRARDANQFRAALESWGAPGVNQLFATTDGDIGWQAAGAVPRRRGWDGSLPVPGDGRFEWDGFARAPELPGSANPQQGWLQTANEMNLSDDYLAEGVIPTRDWYSSARADRLSTWLSDRADSSVEESVAMQGDTLDVHAIRIVDHLRDLDPQEVGEVELLRELLAWDGHMAADSRPALLFEVWIRRFLRPALTAHHLVAAGAARDEVADAVALIDKDESFGGDLRGELRMLAALRDSEGTATLALMVDSTLAGAVKHLTDLLGTDRSVWVWGAVHHSLLTNAVFAADPTAPAGWRALGPRPRAGNGDTVGNAGYDANFRQTIGSSFRMVADVGDWDATRVLNAPGQSGDPRSIHYADHFESWIAGGSFPLVYSRAAVEEHTRTRLLLRGPDPEGDDRV